MFENCMSLKELNMARVQACSSGVPIVEVNNAYNNRKKELLASNVVFTQVNVIPVKITKPDCYTATLVYRGQSRRLGVIDITKDGVYA